MNPAEFIFGAIVVLLLLSLAGYFAWRQIQTLKRVSKQSDLSFEDRLYFRNQAWRRLFSSVLMLVLAGLLVGSYFLDREYREVTEKASEEKAEKAPLKEDDKAFLRRFTMYWIVALTVLFVFAVIAAVDIRATLRYGYRHHRQLRDEHRAALEEQVRVLRQQRNGDD